MPRLLHMADVHLGARHNDMGPAAAAQRADPTWSSTYATDLDHVADAYAAMDERRAIKSLLTISQP